MAAADLLKEGANIRPDQRFPRAFRAPRRRGARSFSRDIRSTSPATLAIASSDTVAGSVPRAMQRQIPLDRPISPDRCVTM